MFDQTNMLEVCVDSVESALIAQSGGAHRVEFCDNLLEGGTTPSLGQIKTARKLLNIRLYPIIRPRGGDFLYSDMAFDIMKEDVRLCGESGCDGVVIGMLLADGSIDVKRSMELVNIAKKYGMGVTFHRAFDRSKDLSVALEQIIDLGCERILTSGGKETAMAGADVIKRLIAQASGRIIIMPGAGVTVENIQALLKETGAKEVHGTLKSPWTGEMQYINREIKEGGVFRTDIQKVKEAVRLISSSVIYTQS